MQYPEQVANSNVSIYIYTLVQMHCTVKTLAKQCMTLYVFDYDFGLPIFNKAILLYFDSMIRCLIFTSLLWMGVPILLSI